MRLFDGQPRSFLSCTCRNGRKRVAPLFRPINANAELDHAGQAAPPLLNLTLGVGKHIQTRWNAIVLLPKYANPYAPENSAAWTGFASQLRLPEPLQMVHAREQAAATSALRLAVSLNAAIPTGSTVGIHGLPRAGDWHPRKRDLGALES